VDDDIGVVSVRVHVPPEQLVDVGAVAALLTVRFTVGRSPVSDPQVPPMEEMFCDVEYGKLTVTPFTRVIDTTGAVVSIRRLAA
jgi:hypothetical protein